MIVQAQAVVGDTPRQKPIMILKQRAFSLYDRPSYLCNSNRQRKDRVRNRPMFFMLAHCIHHGLQMPSTRDNVANVSKHTNTYAYSDCKQQRSKKLLSEPSAVIGDCYVPMRNGTRRERASLLLSASST